MASRLQYILLNVTLPVFLGTITSLSPAWAERAPSAKSIDSEYFEIGLMTGFLNAQDFGSGLVAGVNVTFKATENFFLQLNVLEANIADSSQEVFIGASAEGRSDTFEHTDFVLGYNIFQGEVFRGTYVGLSTFYAVAGVGGTKFGPQSEFSYTIGLGYQMALSRRYTLRIDYRNYINDSTLANGNESTSVNTHLGLGLTWLF